MKRPRIVCTIPKVLSGILRGYMYNAKTGRLKMLSIPLFAAILVNNCHGIEHHTEDTDLYELVWKDWETYRFLTLQSRGTYIHNTVETTNRSKFSTKTSCLRSYFAKQWLNEGLRKHVLIVLIKAKSFWSNFVFYMNKRVWHLTACLRARREKLA